MRCLRRLTANVGWRTLSVVYFYIPLMQLLRCSLTSCPHSCLISRYHVIYFMELRPARFCNTLSNLDGNQKARWDEEICIAFEAFCHNQKRKAFSVSLVLLLSLKLACSLGSKMQKFPL